MYILVLRANLQVQPPSFSPEYVLDTIMEHAFAEVIEVTSFWGMAHYSCYWTFSLKLR